MKIASTKKDLLSILYFPGLIFTLFILFFLLGGINNLSVFILGNVDFVYRREIILTIPCFLSSLIGYIFLRIFDFYLIKRKIIGAQKVFTRGIISWVSTRIPIWILDLLIAILTSLLNVWAFYSLVSLFGWISFHDFPQNDGSILERIVHCFFTSFREEFIFRFFLLSSLAVGFNMLTKLKISILVSLLISSILFGLFHYLVIQERGALWSLILSDISTGMVLGAAYILTKSLWFSLGFHLGWNFFLGAIPVINGFTINNLPGWYGLLAIPIILLILLPIYIYSRSFLQNRIHWLW
jgi:membrane protease YdiL (CAAX protease family)